MANEKFTPGPWKIDDYDLCAIITGADGELVETVYTGKPNASLIAAAPDLYAALEKLLKHCPLSGDMTALIRVVQGGGKQAADHADALVDHYLHLDEAQDQALAALRKAVPDDK